MEDVILMTLKKITWMIPGLILACGMILGIAVIGLHQDFSFLSPGARQGNDLPVFQGQTGSLEIATAFPASPESVSLYRVLSIDRIEEGNETRAFSTKKAIPSAADAPALAEQDLEKYGGLPQEARLTDAVPRYISKFNLTTNSVEERYPVATQVRYVQMLNGLPVIGAGINLDLGEDNEIIRILKIWPAYEYTGEGKVIPAESGFEKLKKGDTLEKAQGSLPDDTKISEIQLGYRLVRAGTGVKEPFLKPVWIYYAVTPLDPEPFPLVVDATA
jgi:hypothetical protein